MKSMILRKQFEIDFQNLFCVVLRIFIVASDSSTRPYQSILIVPLQAHGEFHSIRTPKRELGMLSIASVGILSDSSSLLCKFDPMCSMYANQSSEVYGSSCRAAMPAAAANKLGGNQTILRPVIIHNRR